MNIFLNILIILLFPFLFSGVINKTKAFWSGRKGAPVLQPFYDFLRLLRKAQVISNTTTWVFNMAPIISTAAILMAATLTPILNKPLYSFNGDFVVFAYLLALAKFFMIIAAFDTGSSFEVMGAAREAFFTALVEPAFFIILGTLSFLNHSLSLSAFFSLPQNDTLFQVLIIILLALALLIMLLTEGSRVPVDDPNTHLELTMVHEVMILDNSGPDLAFITYLASLKMLLISSLLANLFMPINPSIGITALLYVLVIFVIAFFIGSLESLFARLRLTHVPQFILLMTSLALLFLAITLLYSIGVK